MDKAELRQFIEYCSNYRVRFARIVPEEDITHIYEQFGQEFIFDLPVEYKNYSINDIKYTVIQGTSWMHSTTGPVYVYNNKPEFYILGYRVSLDEWLPLSALSPEEQIMFKLKHG